MSMILCIDLGTTYSVMAYADENGTPHLVENAESEILTPSVVLIEDGVIEVGLSAANHAILKSDKVGQWIKRRIGDDDYRFQGLSPVEISAEILRKLKRDAEVQLSIPISQAVITCPLYFSAPEVENTKRAGELAGLEVMDIVKEPIAAAVYCAVSHQLSEGERLLVYDLGGRNFDVTILEFKRGEFIPLALLGNRRGGHDVTLALLRFVSHQLSEKFGEDPQNDPQVHQALYEHCEMAKKNLSRVQRVTIPCIFKGRSEQVEVEADTLDQLVEPYLRATLFSCEAVLNKPNPPLTWRDIHQVLLVGGSTRLRRVSGALQTLTGLVPIATPEVDTMVALGAATIARGYFKPREALIASDQFSTDIQLHKASSGCPLRNLGTRVIVWEEGRPRLDNAVIIPEHTVIPAEISREDFAIAVPNQLYFDIPVLEYDGFTGDILGTYRFHCLPQTPKGSRIRLTFRYDLSGIPEVEALDLRTGKLLYREKVECYIEPDLNNLISRSRTMDQIHDNFVDDSLVVTNISALQLQPRFDENVQFTVYRPRLVAPEIWYPLLAFAHLAERPPDAPPTEPDPLQDVKRQAEQVLAEKISRYQELTQESIQGIPKEGELTFLLELPGFELNPPRRTFRWLESVHREEFRLRASREIDGSTVRGRLSVFLGSIIIAEITLTIRVDEKQAGRSLLDISSSSSCFMFRKIFASYSRKDIVIVEEFETDLHKIGLGDEYYYDMRQLRTGEIWNHRLQELIKEANIFQLFWSWNSMGSPFVHQEWRYALSLNRPSFVRPVYWQEPFPEIPEERLPPEELRRLHFKKVYPRTLSKEPPPSPKLGPSSDGLPVLGSGRKEKAASSWGSKLSQATEACPKIDDPISHCFIAKESQEERFTKVKQRIHRLLFERLDLIQLELLEESLVAREIQQALTMLLEEEAEPLSLTEKTRLTQELKDEILGWGPLEPLMRDPAISEILVNGYDRISIKKFGRLERAKIYFQDNNHLLQIIHKIFANAGRPIDESTPMMDCRLPDGSHATSILPPLSVDGPMLSIHRFSALQPNLEELIQEDFINQEIAEVLQSIVVGKLNILISGGRASGKTTLLNVLSRFIPNNEKIFVIEELTELNLHQDHLFHLETRLPDIDGKGKVNTRDLVRRSLLMRPDRIILGEVKGAEVLDTLQAMNAGYPGFMTTIHAFSPRDALLRLETMVGLAAINAQKMAIRYLISSAIDVIIHVARQHDGVCRMTSLSEVTGMEEDVISMQDVFVFERQRVDGRGKIVGKFAHTGIQPKFALRCHTSDMPLNYKETLKEESVNGTRKGTPH